MVGGSTCLYSSRSLQICPLLKPYSFGKSVLVETSRAGAPFPHCCAAHGASGGPRAPSEPHAPRTGGVRELGELRSAPEARFLLPL